jgi:hypothetical protein
MLHSNGSVGGEKLLPLLGELVGYSVGASVSSLEDGFVFLRSSCSRRFRKFRRCPLLVDAAACESCICNEHASSDEMIPHWDAFMMMIMKRRRKLTEEVR